MAFTPDHVEADIDRFRERIGQYVFISSASAYQAPPSRVPITDGTSLWTLTHSEDFAEGFVPLLGSTRTLGEAFHITSDDLLAWNQIIMILAKAAGAEPRIVHVPSDVIAAADPDWGATLLGDSAHSMIFDNSKLRSVVPDYVATITLEQAAPEIIAWHDEDQSRQRVDADLDSLMDKLSAEFRRPG